MKHHLLKDLDALAEITGEHLIGSTRPVWINFQQPAIRAARGIAARDKRGGVIDIAIDQTELEQLEALLHELAHLKLHWDKLPIFEDEKSRMAPRSIDLTVKEINGLGLNDQQDEQEAEKQASKWMTWADENYKAQRGANEIEQRLVALLDYFEVPEDLTLEDQEIFKTIYPKVMDRILEQEAKGLKVK